MTMTITITITIIIIIIVARPSSGRRLLVVAQ